MLMKKKSYYQCGTNNTNNIDSGKPLHLREIIFTIEKGVSPFMLQLSETLFHRQHTRAILNSGLIMRRELFLVYKG